MAEDPTAAYSARAQKGSRPLRRLAGVTSALLVSAILFGELDVPTSNAASPVSDSSQEFAAPRDTETQRALDAMVDNGTPGVIARVNRNHQHWSGTAGVADLERRRPRIPAEHIRIGSITKTFTAVTLLKLEAEGQLSLDDSFEKWLPGVLDRNENDGRSITVRQLLNHTSGVYDVLRDRGFFSRYVGETFFDHRFDDWTPRQLIDIAISHPPLFEPGTNWSYSNTNYILAGMIIEAATGTSYADAVERTLLRRLRLEGTTLPGRSAVMPQPHAQAYSTLFDSSPDAEIYNVTEFNPSLAGANGEMISTTKDLNRFMAKLMNGSILPSRQQRELLNGVDTGDGYRYGLGVRSYPLSCGTFWGNDGDIFGSVTYTVSSGDGSHVLSLHSNDNWSEDELARRVLDTEFCD